MNSIKKFAISLLKKKPKQHVSHQTVNYAQARNFGLLFFASPSHSAESLDRFVKKLKADGKNVQALAFFDKLEQRPPNFAHHSFTEKEISLSGKINSKIVDEFLDEAFDYLLCFNFEEPLLAPVLLSRTRAKCRVGLFSEKHKAHFDIMLATANTSEELFEGMWAQCKAISFNK